jgi:hypothetical protein
MRRGILARLSNQAGVAMVTVLFIGAALTALASAAAFGTIQEFRASGDDTRGAEALAYAEAGIDRMIEYIRSGQITWNDMRLAGCSDGSTVRTPLLLPTGTAGGNVGDLSAGKFTAQMEVAALNADPALQVPPGACLAPAATENPRGTFHFAITSTGTHPAATRVIRQIISISALGLPVGIFAQNVTAGGTPIMDGLSLISPNNIYGREFIAFKGTDYYYKLSDFWPGMSTTVNAPAAVHTTAAIYLKQNSTNLQEHPSKTSPSTLNCTANRSTGDVGQSMWDQSGPQIGGDIPSGTPQCAGWVGSQVGPPTTSAIASLSGVTPKPDLSDQDYLTLRGSAKQYGLYCKIESDNTKTCTRLGETWVPGGIGGNAAGITVAETDVNFVLARYKTFVAYFEYANGQNVARNDIKWNGSVGPCSSTPGANRTGVVVVRNGNFNIDGSTKINGAVFAREGAVVTAGTSSVNGTIIANTFDNRGSGTFTMNDPTPGCWLQNMPGPFLEVKPLTWSEIDR